MTAVRACTSNTHNWRSHFLKSKTGTLNTHINARTHLGLNYSALTHWKMAVDYVFRRVSSSNGGFIHLIPTLTSYFSRYANRTAKYPLTAARSHRARLPTRTGSSQSLSIRVFFHYFIEPQYLVLSLFPVLDVCTHWQERWLHTNRSSICRAAPHLLAKIVT